MLVVMNEKRFGSFFDCRVNLLVVLEIDIVVGDLEYGRYEGFKCEMRGWA